jgi:beta-glucosidase
MHSRIMRPLAAMLALLPLAAQATGMNAAQADAQARKWVSQLTLDEKIRLVHGVGMPSPMGGAGYIPGVPRLGIPGLASADSSGGVGGLNVPDSPVTLFPSPLALAASWDTGLAYRYGAQIADELRALGFAQGLGGGVNLAREPRNGRTFEYLGEDPLLAGRMSAARSLGTRSRNVIATVKHFAGNDQETDRFQSNSIVDERTLHELTLLPFEIAVREGKVGNVMCAYNKLNGQKACENKSLLSDTLKGRWGFRGTVQSDWIMAVTDTVAAANAGLDEEQPGSQNDYAQQFGVYSHFNQRLKQAVLDGRVPRARLDDMVERKLRTMLETGIVARPPHAGGRIDGAAGHALAREVAESSIVLLKNEANALPLDAHRLRRIVVIGGHADQGMLEGGGSGGAGVQSSGNAPSPHNAVACLRPDSSIGSMHLMSGCATWLKTSPLAALRARAPGVEIDYLDGSDIAAAARAAANADAAIVFATQWESEDMDLPSLALPDAATDPANENTDQQALIRAVAARAHRSIVVLENGTAVTMPWADKTSAIVAAWYPGIEGATALTRVLFGDVNPSGKLPLSFPRSEADLPSPARPAAGDVHYKEGLAIGYRWYDSRDIAPAYPFGFGLSYTSFSYSGLQLAHDAGGNLHIRFRLANTGGRAGAEVSQVYVGLPPDGVEPPWRLVAWDKRTLAAGGQEVVEITVPKQRLAVWDAQRHDWRIPAGSFVLKVGDASRDPHALETTFTLPDSVR